jgi:hypothetical protein
MAGTALWQLDEFSAPVMLGFIRGLEVPQNYLGRTLLPDRIIPDSEFEYLKGVNEQPVMAHIIGYDSEAPIAGRPGLGERVRGELPLIKRKARVSEKEIQRFMTPRTGTADLDAAIRAVYDDTARLVRSIQARMEWLRMQALSEDVVVYNDSGVIIQFNYGVPDEAQITLGATAGTATDGTGATVAEYGPHWSDVTNATVITDLMTICDEIEQRTGERPARMVMSRRTSNYFLRNAQIKGWTYATNAPDRPLTQEEVNQTFARYGIPGYQVYDTKVGSENVDGTTTQVRTMRENVVLLLPAGNVGQTLWGPTAESRELLGTPYAQQAPGLWANTYGTDEPPAQWTKAVAAAFPSLPEVDKIGQLTVYPAA